MSANSHNNFRLQGHDNPLGKYPASVLPVGDYNGRRVVVYLRDDSKVELLPYGEDKEECPVGFVKYDTSKLKSLTKFSWNRDRLFAFGEDEVEIYEARIEAEYYKGVLQSRDFTRNEPFIALAMARVCDDRKLISQAFEECLKVVDKFNFGGNKDELLKWYSDKRLLIGDWLPEDPFQKKNCWTGKLEQIKRETGTKDLVAQVILELREAQSEVLVIPTTTAIPIQNNPSWKSLSRLFSILRSPVVSEKAFTAGGPKSKCYVFRILRGATKPEIETAVETIFNVVVKKVGVLNVKGKFKRHSGVIGRRGDYRKAYVMLQPGYSIEMIDNAVFA